MPTVCRLRRGRTEGARECVRRSLATDFFGHIRARTNVSLLFILSQISLCYGLSRPCTTLTSLLTLQPPPPAAADKLKVVAERLHNAVAFLSLKDRHFADRPNRGPRLAHELPQRNQYQRQTPAPALPIRPLKVPGAMLRGTPRHYDYDNIWHGLSTVFPFVAWHRGDGCRCQPEWRALCHWDELWPEMVLWLSKLIEVTFGKPPSIDVFDKIKVKNEGGMSRERRLEAFDSSRCSVRRYCNLSSEVHGDGKNGKAIRLMLLMRREARSFRNESAVIGIFQRVAR
ncbi:uncharacterized protein LOC104420679 [Eucalyptus grandis]|uniref:uncharacterized protein LOC104420679 n=1 Tax=Eucalyptus grandis TaxID=71139 RepID=UPI00192EB008|nr:uncharacterized protein LOC104420679 [Eucalyptus grandis]